MALPTSTIVMALITAVPFGLAIKDTVQGKTPYSSLADDYDDHDEYDIDDYRTKAQAEFDEQQAKEKDAIISTFDELIPTSTVGELRGFVLNSDVPLDSDLQRRLQRTPRAEITPTRKPDGALKSVRLVFPEYRGTNNICSLLEHRLEQAWGRASRSTRDGVGYWHYVAAGKPQRVTYLEADDNNECSLVLEESIRPSEFITKTETSTVPLWAVGKPAAALVAKLGGDAYSSSTQIRWMRPGVGAGFGETELYARVVKGKIVTITARFRVSEHSVRELAETLIDDHGTPIDGDPVVWKKSKLSLETVDDAAGDYLVVAGDALPSSDEE